MAEKIEAREVSQQELHAARATHRDALVAYRAAVKEVRELVAIEAHTRGLVERGESKGETLRVVLVELREARITKLETAAALRRAIKHLDACEHKYVRIGQ